MANQNPPQFGTRTLEDFKARLIGGGARPNLFEVEINFPTFALVGDTPGTGINDDTRSVSDLTQFMCKAAQLPASNIAEIPVPFRGRVLKSRVIVLSIPGLSLSLTILISKSELLSRSG